MEQSVPKRPHIKFRRPGITQKKAYKNQNTANVWNKKFYFPAESNLITYVTNSYFGRPYITNLPQNQEK